MIPAKVEEKKDEKSYQNDIGYDRIDLGTRCCTA